MTEGANFDWPAIDRARLAAARSNDSVDGVDDRECGPSHRQGGAASAPASPEFGISSYELAQYVRDFARWCAQRVEGPGMVEYDRGSHQKFEVMSTQELVQGLQEELADAQNYIAMISLLIGRLAKSLPKESDEREKDPGRS